MRPFSVLAVALFLPWLAGAAQVKLPPYTRQVLPNGAVVLLMPRAGSASGHDACGAARRRRIRSARAWRACPSVTAELLRRGSAGRTADEFSEALDFLGATWQASSDDQTTQVGMEFLSKDLDRALGLFADALLRPAFPDAEVRKVAGAEDRRLQGRQGQSILGHRACTSGRSSTVRPIPTAASRTATSSAWRASSGAHIADYHRRMYAGRNLILIAVGQFDADALAGQACAGFRRGARRRRLHLGAGRRAKSEAPRPGCLLVDKPDATQTYFQIGQPGIHRTSPDRIPLWLVNTLFGGRFTSMLNDELRVNSGLTYGASCRLEQNRLTGGIVISTYTRTDATEKAIDMALGLLKRLGEKGITAEQLASAKAYLKGLYPTQRLETSDQLAETLTRLRDLRLGPDGSGRAVRPDRRRDIGRPPTASRRSTTRRAA